MTQLYPLRFEPILRHYLWGGRRLATELGKSLGDDPAAESWELCDREKDQSFVSAGPLAGVSLGELVRERGSELLGQHAPQPRFPLLFKFIDARQTLSVQVHPDDARAARLQPPDLGKTEAWYVMATEPGGTIYAGLKRGVDRSMLAREVARGTSDLCLNKFEARVGDCFFVPAGLPHAIGAGLLVAEIQQSSDTTYRLFDWNRVGPDGQPRPLHVEHALEAIDYGLSAVGPHPPQSAGYPGVERLIRCDKFVLDRWSMAAEQAIGGDDRCHCLAVVEGALSVSGDAKPVPLGRGGTILLPASVGKVSLRPQGRAVFLDAYLP